MCQVQLGEHVLLPFSYLSNRESSAYWENTLPSSAQSAGLVNILSKAFLRIYVDWAPIVPLSSLQPTWT